MRSRLARIQIAIGTTTLLLMASCRQALQCDYFDFDFQKPLDYDQLIFRSSAIVVGTVVSVNVTRGGVPARKAPHLLLDETRVEIRVENVLLGDLNQPRLFFKFFGISLQNKAGYDGPPPYRVTPGDRRVFFLTEDRGEYRSAGDVRDYTLPVWSGLHRNIPTVKDVRGAYWTLHRSDGVGDRISAVLLELGENYSLEGMVHDLSSMAHISETLSTRKATVGRLQKLLGLGREPPIRVAACLLLSERYPGQYGCLSILANDESLPADARNQVAAMQAKLRDSNARLKLELRKRPLYAFHIDSIVGVRDELELLLDDPDPELRQLACAVLRQNFRSRHVRCPPRYDTD